METERYNKVKQYAKQQMNYEYMKDKKLETKLDDVTQMIEDIQYNDQKVFCENICLCIVADTYSELEEQTVKIQNKVGEMLIRILPLKWQQLEGITHYNSNIRKLLKQQLFMFHSTLKILHILNLSLWEST